MTHDGPHDGPRPSDETAALYASGAMTPDEQHAVEADLARDESLKNAVNDLDIVAKALLDTVPSVEPRPGIREAVLRATGHSTDKKKHDHQVWHDWEEDVESEDALFTLPKQAGRWEDTGIEGIEVRRLFVDRENNRMTAMFRMAPGAAYVPHVHDGAEECYVLEGDLHVGDDIVMHAGDYQRAAAGSVHGVQRTEGGCVLLISSSLHDEVIE